jgi:hypothetical protein
MDGPLAGILLVFGGRPRAWSEFGHPVDREVGQSGKYRTGEPVFAYGVISNRPF